MGRHLRNIRIAVRVCACAIWKTYMIKAAPHTRNRISLLKIVLQVLNSHTRKEMKWITVILVAIVVCRACTEAHKAAKHLHRRHHHHPSHHHHHNHHQHHPSHTDHLSMCYCPPKIDCRVVRLSCSPDKRNITNESVPAKRRNNKCHPEHCHCPGILCTPYPCLNPCEQCFPGQGYQYFPPKDEYPPCCCPFYDCKFVKINCTIGETARENIADEQPAQLIADGCRACPEDRCETLRQKCCPR